MTQGTLRRALLSAALCAALPALAPAAASASTYTVDDDLAQCPNASFRSIQAAVDQAAPWDTVVVCDGVYEEQSTPASGNGSPSQAGSRNGLTITKPLTIRGAGASKVTIMPSSSLTTLAGTAPYLRDGGGNVVTVSRQSRDATDMNTMFVDISGVTITSGATYAEAGVAFFNASGAVRSSVVGPLVRAADSAELAARPHGWGVVVSNSQQGAEAGPRREVSIEGSLVTGYQSGGVLFDDARGADGAPETLVRSGIVQYGFVRDSTIQGFGSSALIPQTGVQFHAGQRGAISGSTISGHLFPADPRRSVGVLLTDAETGLDPANPPRRAFTLTDSLLTGNGYGLFNANAANDAVRLGAPAAATFELTGDEPFWGCGTGPVIGGPSADDPTTTRDPSICQGVSGRDSAGALSVELGRWRAAAPPLAAVPAPVADTAPVVSFGDPAGGVLEVGQSMDPVVLASDDFGVRSVSVTRDGEPVGSAAAGPYEFSTGWTPGFEDLDATFVLTATVTDSAGQTTVVTDEVTVVPPPGYEALSLDAETADFGSVVVGTGAAAERVLTVTNSGQRVARLGAFDVAGDGFSVAGGAGSCVPGGSLEVGASCTVVARFAPAAAGAATGTLSVSYDAPGGGDPLVVALSGAGVAPAVRGPDPRDPEPPAPPVLPAVVTAPSVTGRALVGRVVTCAPGTWSGAPTSYAYQWLRDGAAIAGATSARYRLARVDMAARVSCRVIAANTAGAGAAAASPVVRVVLAASSTRTTTTKQAGPTIATFPKRVVTTRRASSVVLARVLCLRPGGCTVRATGRLTIGRARFAVSLRGRAATSRILVLRARLSSAARRALSRSGSGALALRVTGRGSSVSGTAATTIRLAVRR